VTREQRVARVLELRRAGLGATAISRELGVVVSTVTRDLAEHGDPRGTITKQTRKRVRTYKLHIRRVWASFVNEWGEWRSVEGFGESPRDARADARYAIDTRYPGHVWRCVNLSSYESILTDLRQNENYNPARLVQLQRQLDEVNANIGGA